MRFRLLPLSKFALLAGVSAASLTLPVPPAAAQTVNVGNSGTSAVSATGSAGPNGAPGADGADNSALPGTSGGIGTAGTGALFGTPGANVTATTTATVGGAGVTHAGGAGGDGGVGGNGGAGGIGAVGGDGGAAGAAAAGGNGVTVIGTGTVSVTGGVNGGAGGTGGAGGNGGAGGAGNNGGSGGNGGLGGDGGAGLFLNAAGTVNLGDGVTPTTVVGGAAGLGGAGGVGGIGGIGGANGLNGVAGANGTAGFGVHVNAAGATVNINGAAITQGAAGVDAVRGVAGSTINFQGTNTLTGDLNSAGTVNVGGISTNNVANGAASSAGQTVIGTSQAAGSHTINGNVVNSGTFITGLGATQARTGQILQGGGAARTNDLTGASIRPFVTDAGLAGGQRVVLIQNSNAGTTYVGTGTAGQTTTAAFATDSSFNTVVRSWSVGTGNLAAFSGTDRFGSVINNQDLVLRADVATGQGIVGNRTAGQSSAFNTAANFAGTTPSLVVLNQAVQNLNTVDGVRRAVDQLRPEVSGATTQVPMTALNGSVQTIDNRNNAVRLASFGFTGLATGDETRGIGVWGEAFGSTLSQSAHDGFSGYRANSGGVSFGADTQITSELRFGLALAYARGDVDEKGLRSGNNMNVDSYMASLYGSWTTSMMYVDVTATAGRHAYDHTRRITLDTFVRTASANYDATQFAGKAEVGFPIKVAERVYVAPLANLAYAHTRLDGYTETGAEGANLTVEGRSIDSVRAGVGASLAASVKSGSVTFTPSVKAMYVRDFGSANVDSTVRFADGGSSFVVTGAKPERDAGIVGIGLTAALGNGVSLSATYNGEVRSNLVGHAGFLRVRYDF